MKIYLAARYSRHPEMQHVARELAELGHDITSRWIWGSHQMDDSVSPDSGAGHVQAAHFAGEDMIDLRRADVIVSFTESQRTPSRGGRHAEFGAGLALGKRMVVVGPCEHVFHYLPEVEHCENVKALIAKLDCLETRIDITPLGVSALFDNQRDASASDAIKGR